MPGSERGGTGAAGVNPVEELTVLLTGISVGAAVLTVATWQRLLGWLVDQGVLVPATQSPMIALPAGHGVGLDPPRVAIAVAGLVFAVVCAVAAFRRRGVGEER